MTNFDLIIDLHLRNPRQGPGCDTETRRALDLCRLDHSAPITVADIGCGTGASTLALANSLDAHITAVDFAEPFIDRLRERAAQTDLTDRITTQVASMDSLPFRENQFDLIWSEGAIYNMGFAAGLHAWRPFLRPGAVLAVSHLTWTTATRPDAIHQHWSREYHEITTASANLRTIEQEGYEPIAFFFLPPHCWEDNYYAPLRAGFDAFLARHNHSVAARQIIAAEEAEMQLYNAHSQWYGYAFYIALKIDSAQTASPSD